MLFVHATREDLLDCLPQGIVCAEVGVAEGDFSAQILARVKPAALHLIDPWVRQERDDYNNDPNNAQDDEQERRHAAVLARFQGSTAIVHRAFSVEQAGRFAAATFDAVYIDAMHTHDAVIADLAAFAPLLKADGLLMGHDFVSHQSARQMNFGVIGGVMEFAKRSGFEMLALTAESFATYVLARRGAGGSTRDAFVRRLLASGRFVVELPNELAGAFQHKMVNLPGQPRARLLPSFRV